jgi:threonine aldolase
VLATGLIGLRFVTHLDVDAPGIDHALACIRQFFNDQASRQHLPEAAGAGVY